jgi:hypothetical protein
MNSELIVSILAALLLVELCKATASAIFFASSAGRWLRAKEAYTAVVEIVKKSADEAEKKDGEREP